MVVLSNLSKRAFVILVRLVQGLLDLVAVLLGNYYSFKFAAIARRLGLPLIPPSPRRGFIIIQVDGLSGCHIDTAMAQGYAPHLQRLLRRGDFRLSSWNPGLPCTTPAVQCGIMFGNNDDIPAFRWYDKVSGETSVCTAPNLIQEIQERVSPDQRGILHEGSSYMNMFDGDASLSMFTLGALNRAHFFESVRGLGFALLFVLNPFRTIKTLLLALWEYATDLVQRTMASVRKTTPRPIPRNFPFLRVMANVVLREIQTFAVLVDVYRGVPALYTTYYGYDEVAHQYGPLSKPALRALHAIDTRIGQIDRFRRLGLGREHDLFVLSDHGMTCAIPFQRQYGQTLGELLRALAGRVAVDEEQPDYPAVSSAIYLQEELLAIESNVRPSLARITRRIRKMVQARSEVSVETALPSERRSDLVVRNSGSLSHVYLGVTAKQMDLGQVLATYPNLVASLVAHDGIWLVIGRQDDRLVVVSPDGVLSYGETHARSYRASTPSYVVEGSDPLATVSDSHRAARQLYRLVAFPHAGDLIIMGNYDSVSDTVSCFEGQWACHSGLGGGQNVAFMMIESHIDWDVRSIEQATELYPLFARRYGLS